MKGAATPAEADASVYPELANANVLRMRGDLKGAESALLSVLRRYPNNASAHEMLGDLAIEKRDIQHAVEWYELGLDLAPDSTALQDKLSSARAKQATRETDDTASQIGLPPEKPKTPMYALLFVIGLLVVGGTAYLLGTKSVDKLPAPNPIVTTTDSAPTANPQSVAQPPATTATTPQNPAAPGPQDDRKLQELLAKTEPDGGRIVSVSQDPRIRLIMVTFTAEATENPRTPAARLAKLALEQLPDAQMVTVRASQDGKLTYVADVSRTKLDETNAPTWTAQNPDAPDAWIDHVLTNEWHRPIEGGSPSTSSADVPATTDASGNTGQ